MNQRLRTAPMRLPRANYGPRALSFAACFAVVALLALEHDWPAGALVFPALYLLLYPHLVLLATRLVRKPKRLEIRAMKLDAVMLGIMCAHIDFFPWLSYAFLSATILNNVVVGGPRQLFQALALFLTGALAWGQVRGWPVVLDTPFYIEALSMTLLLLYVLMVGLVLFSQNNRLARTRDELATRNRVFAALLDISVSADLTTDVEAFIDDALSRIHRLYPANGFGLVIRRRNRPEVPRLVGFAGISADGERALLAGLARLDPREDGTGLAEHADYRVLPLKGNLQQDEGLFIIRGERTHPLPRDSLRLLLDMLGATIENRLMTLDLKQAAETDPLTGVFNRGYLDRQLKLAIEQHRKHPAMHFAVLLIDLLSLKRVNDTHGHDAGDQLIRETARSLQATCRATDVLARYGGDEFVILCQASDEAGADNLRRRILENVAGRSVALNSGRSGALILPIRLSIGVAGSSHCPAEEVLRTADERMYRDKEAWYRDHSRYR